MPTALVVTAGFNFVVLALTPVERWKAAGRFNTNFMTEHWFVLTGAAAIIILTALLLMVSYNRAAKEQKLTEQLFAKYAKKRGLSRRERQILLEIARKAGLKRGEAIFTMGSAFNRGAAKMIEESLGRREQIVKNRIVLPARKAWLPEKNLHLDRLANEIEQTEQQTNSRR
ncbi:MAG: hypothetical protein ACYTEW_00970 [Planctomycetota bacterium]